MWKKILFGLLGVALVAGLGLFLWVRSVLANNGAQRALAAQISTAIGQPVTIQGLSARIYPRIGVSLDAVVIGAKSEITVASLELDTDFRALLSRRIEHASVHLNGARVQMPLPSFTLGSKSPTPAPESEGSAVEIVSIDEVILSGIEIVSGGRTLKGEIDVVPQGNGVDIRTIILSAEDMSLTATGKVTDLGGPNGELTVKAGALNVDRLIAFFNEFSSGLASPTATASAAPASAAAPVTPATPPTSAGSMRLTVNVEAERATLGGLTIDEMRGRAVATDTSVALEPLTFNLFGGKYDGGLSATLGSAQPTFKWKAAISGIDVAAATAYAGSPNTITGTLDGNVDIWGSGSDVAAAMKTVAGNVRLQVRNGVVRNLGIIRSVGAATSLSLASLKNAARGGADTDEPFTRLGGDIVIANGMAATENLAFEATDLQLTARGAVHLNGSAMDLQGRLQLSEALSAEVNSTMLRLSQDKGKVTLPATITGTFAAPNVRVDVGDITRRAVKNTVTEAAPKLLNKGIGRLLGK